MKARASFRTGGVAWSGVGAFMAARIGIKLRGGRGADAPPAVSQGTRRMEPCHGALPVKLLQGSSRCSRCSRCNNALT